MIVAAYLLAIVAANVTAVIYGPTVTVLNAFLFIGFDLTMRDHLHDKWHGSPTRMGALIAVGSILSYAVNRGAGRIAIASLIAFAVAGAVDWAVYRARETQPRWRRITESNVVSALADSLVFPTVAFGSFMPLIVLGQWAAKVVGGGLWTWVLVRVAARR